jgi:hypothetical protein
MSTKTIEQVLGHLREPFIIAEDGSSQTRLSNHGRVGFYVERQFGILPNRDRSPDFGDYELKTTQPDKKISIGTMPESEFARIKREATHIFAESNPYAKIKNTLLVVYTKLSSYPEPCYYMNGWGLLNLEKMSDRDKLILQEDYNCICEIIKKYCNSRDEVTDFLRSNGSISGKYLTLSYKGQGDWGYNYPAWGFQAKFMKLVTHA